LGLVGRRFLWKVGRRFIHLLRKVGRRIVIQQAIGVTALDGRRNLTPTGRAVGELW
jgi:hypothetical protein